MELLWAFMATVHSHFVHFVCLVHKIEMPFHKGTQRRRGGETHMLPPTSFLLVFYGFSSGCLTFYVTAINFQWHCRFILHTGEWLARSQPPLAVCGVSLCS